MGTGLYAPELEYRYLGGIKEIFDEGAQTLEKLGMLNPPRATDLRLSNLGQTAECSTHSEGRFERMDRLENGGWHVSGFAVCHDNRPADLILLLHPGRKRGMGRTDDGNALYRTSVSSRRLHATTSSFWEYTARKMRNLALGRRICRQASFESRGSWDCISVGVRLFEREFLLSLGGRS